MTSFNDYYFPGDGQRIKAELHEGVVTFKLRESLETLARDSRWPALFPQSITFVTTGTLKAPIVERCVGATVVNRFPYIVCVSLCRERLSGRHHPRTDVMAAIESANGFTVNILAESREAKTLLATCAETPPRERLARAGLAVRPGEVTAIPVIDVAPLVYECELAGRSEDFEGEPIFDSPREDLGSHTLYFGEVRAIQLDEQIASRKAQILWHSLPEAI